MMSKTMTSMIIKHDSQSRHLPDIIKRKLYNDDIMPPQSYLQAEDTAIESDYIYKTHKHDVNIFATLEH